jgi:Mannosyltransferase (PIG-V)
MLNKSSRLGTSAGFVVEPTSLALAGFALATRLLVVLCGCLLALPDSSLKSGAVRSRNNDKMNPRHLAVLSSGSRRWIEPWYRWDAIWYLDICERGYSFRPGAQSSVAFMPLLPLLIRLSTTGGIDPYWSGLLIPNFAFVVGLVFFGRVVLGVTGSAATTWRVCILLAAFPSAFFFSAPYPESLGFMLTAAALLAWQTSHPALSAAALAAATAARLTALSMSVGLVLEWALALAKGRSTRNRPWLVAGAGTLGTVLFFGYLAVRFGDPFLHFKAHSAWLRKAPSIPRLLETIAESVRVSALMVRSSGSFAVALVLLFAWLLHKPISTVFHRIAKPAFHRRAANGEDDGHEPSRRLKPAWVAAGCATLLVSAGVLALFATGSPIELRSALQPVAQSRNLFATILFLGLGIHAWVRRGPLWGCMVVVPVIEVLASGSHLSMIRVVLSAYPGFVDAAEIASDRVLFATTVLFCLFAQMILLRSYVNWIFVA